MTQEGIGMDDCDALAEATFMEWAHGEEVDELKDEIAALRAENEGLRRALELIRNVYGGMPYEIAKEALK